MICREPTHAVRRLVLATVPKMWKTGNDDDDETGQKSTPDKMAPESNKYVHNTVIQRIIKSSRYIGG
jgi:hypothetical protein